MVLKKRYRYMVKQKSNVDMCRCDRFYWLVSRLGVGFFPICAKEHLV